MIQVTTRTEKGELGTVEFDTNSLEVIDGALVIYTVNAEDLLAGFAPGQWLTWQKL